MLLFPLPHFPRFPIYSCSSSATKRRGTAMAAKLLSRLRQLDTRLISLQHQRPFFRNARLFSGQQIPSSDSHPSLPPTPTPTPLPPPSAGSAGEKRQRTSSLKDHELAKFAAISDTWWDSEGPFKPLHAMNPTRLAFIRSTLCRHFSKDPNVPKPFDGLEIVDVGCGGGILSEVHMYFTIP
ncbi:unnamed protein product [Linum tenue]|uniref:Hexaprenyldihydroxybenzoate methyltransferase n=1 Tax=Linum tenue TaxID=586396 RepID=A0AAV0QIT7_9ROSI|nr:unnamed protein product [Linum tenue]